MNPSATIKLFLPFGDPKRVRTAEISNWSGKAVAAPKTDLADLLVRHELQSSGIYFLIGTNPETAELAAYIGEAEIVSERLKQHKSKEFWNSAIVFVSKDENLTKAHIRYLEGRLLERATMVGRYKLTNTQVSGARLPESDQQDMEVFLERIAQLLPVLGSDILTPAVSLDVTQGAVEYLYCSVKDVQAKGLRSPNGFTVLAGSSAVLKETDSAQKHGAWIVSLRKQLIADGGLIVNGAKLTFTKDIEFASPSAAAGVVRGGTAAGPIVWINKDGKTLKQIEADA
ncbi:DUF4357 domain-containing protein [Paracidovorax avenae]|nr:DUF4357 domain-containing protein [Paracidovorax avenae]